MVKKVCEADYQCSCNFFFHFVTFASMWIIKALPYVNKTDMTLLVKEMFLNRTINITKHGEELLLGLGNVQKPTIKMIQDIKVCYHENSFLYSFIPIYSNKPLPSNVIKTTIKWLSLETHILLEWHSGIFKKKKYKSWWRIGVPSVNFLLIEIQ